MKSAANVTKVAFGVTVAKELLNRSPRRFRPTGAANRWCMVGPAFHPTIVEGNRTALRGWSATVGGDKRKKTNGVVFWVVTRHIVPQKCCCRTRSSRPST